MKTKISVTAGIIFTILSIIGIAYTVVTSITELDFIPATDQDFVKEINKLNCNLNSFPEEENSIGAETYLITDENCPYYITYADISSKGLEEKYLANAKSLIEEKSTNQDEFFYKDEFYTYSSLDDRYMIIVKNGSTYIYADVKQSDSSKVDNLLKNLGYTYTPNTKNLKWLPASICLLIVSFIILIRNIPLLIKRSYN